MFLSLDLANLLLYCAQELGVALGLGAQTILLVAYVQATRDGVIDAEEAQFARAVRWVLNVALFLVVVSGVCIGVIEFVQGNDVLLQPAYLFKWALIVFILLLNVFGGSVPPNLLEGLRGGTWYALFVVHILAPVTGWVNLLTLYAVWMVGFNLVWMALLPLTHQHKKAPKPEPAKKPDAPQVVKAEPKPAPPIPQAPKQPAPPPPPPPKVAAPLPVVQPLEIDKPTQFVPPKPAPVPTATTPVATTPMSAFDDSKAQPLQAPGKLVAPIDKVPDGPPNPWLPKIQIMPKSPDDLKK